jgi:hypothetical protein
LRRMALACPTIRKINGSKAAVFGGNGAAT